MPFETFAVCIAFPLQNDLPFIPWAFREPVLLRASEVDKAGTINWISVAYWSQI